MLCGTSPGACAPASALLTPLGPLALVAPAQAQAPPKPPRKRWGPGPVLHRRAADPLRPGRGAPEASTRRPDPVLRPRRGRRPDPAVRHPASAPATSARASSCADTVSTELGRRQDDGRLRPRAAQGLRGPRGPGLRRDRHGARGRARTDHPGGPGGRPRTTGSRPAARPPQGPRDPTCCSACSTATPTCSRVRTADQPGPLRAGREPARVRKANQVTLEDRRPGRGAARRADGRAGPRGGLRPSSRPTTAPRSPSIYHLGPASADDPTLGPGASGRSGSRSTGRSTRSRSRTSAAGSSRPGRSGSTCVFFQIDSQGGLDTAADDVADMIAGIEGHEDRRLHRRPGPGRLAPWSPWPATTSSSTRRPDGGRPPAHHRPAASVQELDRPQASSSPSRPPRLAATEGPPRGRRPRHGRSRRPWSSRPTDTRPAPSCSSLRSEAEADPARYVEQVPTVRKEAGDVADRRPAEEAADLRPRRDGRRRRRGFKALYGLRGKVDPGRRPDLGRLAGDDPDRPVRELAAAVRRPVHAVLELKLPGHRPAGDHLGPGVPALLLEPLPRAARPTSWRSSCSWSAWSAWPWSCSSSRASASSA